MLGIVARRGRLDRDQLPDRTALAGRVCDGRTARVRRAADRDHAGRPERAEFFEKAQPWLRTHTVADIVELSQAMRIPASPINDGATILDSPQYLERGFFIDSRRRGLVVPRPGAPFRLSKTPALPPRPAPRWVLDAAGATRDRCPIRGDVIRRCPSQASRCLDLSTFWAGAYLTCYLGAFGADVVKVESIQRPDGFRYSGAWAQRAIAGTNAAVCGRPPISTSETSPSTSPPKRAATWHCAWPGGRRRRGELLATGGRAVRAGLRVACGTQSGRDHGAHARVRS